MFAQKEEAAAEVNTAQHQGATHLRKIQCYVNMDSYTVTLMGMHATVTEIFQINAQINNQKQLLL